MSRSRLPTLLLPPLLVVGLLLLFFNKMAFTNLILARGDTFLYFYPYWTAAAEALRAARVPLWNPDLFMGAPLLANSQVGFFYPLNWPVWWLLPTPYAVSASILLHVGIAGLGAYAAARRALGLSWEAGLVTAVLFALGGYLTAQVEHINQLQGMAWLPWFLVALGGPAARGWRGIVARALGIGVLFALQLLAGHTQTTFITGVGLGLWLLTAALSDVAQPAEQSRLARVGRRFAPLLLGGLLALLLAAIQLLPTLQLMQLSSRQGGLSPNEVLSFSLNPLLLARALLPSVGQSLFSEYVAVLPLVGLALAFVGAWQWRRRPGVLPALIWALVGFGLALGVFDPLYWLLARLPGFNLFRVPARWLLLYTLGMALLAGVGWQVLAARVRDWSDERWRVEVARPLQIFLLVALLLMAWGFAAGWLVGIIPLGPEAPFETPTWPTLLVWALELALLGELLIWMPRAGERARLVAPLVLVLLGGVVLFAATRTHPYNNLTTPEAYLDLRSPTTRLLAREGTPPGRLLSLSDIFFDPGDQGEIDSIYADQLPEAARYDYTVAIKQKEIIAPNLPLTYGLPSVDGFDGGILPLSSYSGLVSLTLPPGVETTDGRLRENLTAVPPARWLDLFNMQYLITDKVGDVWRAGVFFDRQHPVTLAAGQSIAVGYMPDYAATELWLLATAVPGPVRITTDGGAAWELAPEPLDDDGLYRVTFPRPAALSAITLTACPDVDPCEVTAVTLVDSRDDTFLSLVPGAYRLIHSGDVKLYENLDVQPRAFLVDEWQWQPSVAASVMAMADAAFDPRATAVLIPSGDERPTPRSQMSRGLATITAYATDRVVVRTESDAPALLVVTDAFYPGWRAALDGEETRLYQANGLFRGVFVPAGGHEVVLSFEPVAWRYGRVISLVALTGLLIAALLLVRLSRA